MSNSGHPLRRHLFPHAAPASRRASGPLGGKGDAEKAPFVVWDFRKPRDHKDQLAILVSLKYQLERCRNGFLRYLGWSSLIILVTTHHHCVPICPAPHLGLFTPAVLRCFLVFWSPRNTFENSASATKNKQTRQNSKRTLKQKTVKNDV